MRFTDPLWLLPLPLIPLLGWAALAWLRSRAERLAKLSRHAPGIPPRARLQTVLVLTALACTLMALAGPRWGRSAETAVTRGRNLMLVVDVSRSMLARDVRPDRLGRAKADLIDLIDALGGERAGVIAFRGKGVLLCPLTSDAAFLRQCIDGLSPDSAPPGETDIADALGKALAAFGESGVSHNAVVLVSDGEDLAGRAAETAAVAGRRGVPVFAVGIGSPGGASIPDGGALLTHDGQTVRTALSEESLRTIAERSGGRYIPLAVSGTAATTLGAVYRRYLTRLDAVDREERLGEGLADRSGIFGFLAALAALTAALLSVGRPGFAALAFLSAPAILTAATPAREAQAAWRDGRYAEAAARYAEARAGAEPSETARLAYNEALALRAAGDVTNALDTVRIAAADPDFAARASDLEGRLLLARAGNEEDPAGRLAAREEAAAAFNRVLAADPDSPAAQRNLARALDGLGQLRRDVRREAALKKYANAQLGQLLPELLTRQRALTKAVPEVFSGPDPELRILQADRLAADVRALADIWYPVLDRLPQAVQDETLRTTLQQGAAASRGTLDAAAEAFADLNPDPAALAGTEPFIYDFWKTVADPPALNAEAIAVQTHAMTGSGRPYMPAREDIPEVAALLDQFGLIFPKWAEAQLQQAQQQAATPPAQGTGKAPSQPAEPAFTEEDRDIILRTVEETKPLAAPSAAKANAQKILDNLNLIREHLPRQSQNQQNQNQNRQQNQQNQNQQQNQQDQQQNQNRQDPDQPSGQDQQDSQDQKPEPSPEEQRAEAERQDRQALLQKAADRSREHEEAKRARAGRFLPPGTRDW